MSEILDIMAVILRLKAADNVLILSHKNPDGDTIGSAGALFHALKSMGKTCAVLCTDEFNKRYDYMQIEMFDNNFEPQYIVAVDVAGLQLFGDLTVEYGKKADLCIDHHPSNSNYSDALLLDSTAAATCEVMYELIEKMGIEITPVIADCLYTGISTDTGCFKFANVTAKTHYITAKLIELGASYIKLNSLLFESKSKARLEIERIALESLEYYFDERCAIIVVTKNEIERTGADMNDLEGITAIPRMIEGVEVGITLRQQQSGSYKVSVRTASNVDACAICSRLGGGGHVRASGCEIIGGLENAKQAVLAEAARELGVEYKF